MPFDANGNYSLPSGYFVTIGDTVLPSQHNPPLQDIASALSSVLMRSGAGAMTGALKMGGFAIQNSGLITATRVATDLMFMGDNTTETYRLISDTFYTSSQSVNIPAGTRRLEIEALGGGGGGGGAAACASGEACGATGGGAGAYTILFYTGSMPGSLALTIGAAGTGGTGASGGVGGNTVVSGGGGLISITAPGGTGGHGPGATSLAGTIPSIPGVNSDAVTGGGVSSRGAGGDLGWASPPVARAVGGRGADSPYGAGGAASRSVASRENGSNASGLGSGGGGAANSSTSGTAAATTGADGRVGMVRIKVFA